MQHWIQLALVVLSIAIGIYALRMNVDNFESGAFIKQGLLLFLAFVMLMLDFAWYELSGFLA